VDDADMLPVLVWLRYLLVYLAYVGDGDGDGESEGEDRLFWLGSFSCWIVLLMDERFWNMLRLDDEAEVCCDPVSL